MVETSPSLFPATRMPDPDWWQALWPEPADVIARIGIAYRMTVVDLCCGDGWFTEPIARMASHVIAIDLDAHLLSQAQARLTESGFTNCEFIEGDAYDLIEFVERPVDFLLIANTFHGVPDKMRLARAMVATLKPAGRLAIINWHRRPRDETKVLGQPRGPSTELRMGPADVLAAVDSSGLKFQEVIELPPYHYAAILANDLVG